MRTLQYLTLAVAVAFVCFWANQLLNSSGQWSATASPLYSIPMRMHGSTVYLTPQQKLLYYDSLGYCWLAGAALGVLQVLLHLGNGRRSARK